MRVYGQDPEARTQAKTWLEEFSAHLATAGLGHVSEIADAEDGNEPRGCIAQAWSVGELLRAAMEDIYGAEPAVAQVLAQTTTGPS
jgi:glycogen debranching enzyme